MESTRIILIKTVNAVSLIIGVFLALRILLKFFAANPSTPFVAWIYSVSSGLVYPFRGIFQDLIIQRNLAIDLSAFIALIAYAIITTIIIAVINALVTPIIVHHDGHAHIQ